MSTVRETAVGLFVLIGLLCVAYLTIKLGKMEVFGQQGFELSANFDSASGLRVGADVEMAGVPVGRFRNAQYLRLQFSFWLFPLWCSFVHFGGTSSISAWLQFANHFGAKTLGSIEGAEAR